MHVELNHPRTEAVLHAVPSLPPVSDHAAGSIKF
jgi:hypothetical protein